MTPTTPAQFIELFMLIVCTIMGLSHIFRPQMWVRYFTNLHAQGTNGIITRTFALELWPALMVVSLHQVWSGPAIVLTIYGCLQMIKVTIAMLAPELALRSLNLAKTGNKSFIGGGFMLLGVAASCGWSLYL